MPRLPVTSCLYPRFGSSPSVLRLASPGPPRASSGACNTVIEQPIAMAPTSTNLACLSMGVPPPFFGHRSPNFLLSQLAAVESRVCFRCFAGAPSPSAHRGCCQRRRRNRGSGHKPDALRDSRRNSSRLMARRRRASGARGTVLAATESLRLVARAIAKKVIRMVAVVNARRVA